VKENLLFSTLILGSVFNDYVVFYGDNIQYWYSNTDKIYRNY